MTHGTTSTDIVDGFGVASTGVQARSIGLPAITVPDLTAVTGAFTASAAPTGSEPVGLAIGSLTDGVRFQPAAAGSSAQTPPPGNNTGGTTQPGTTQPGTAQPGTTGRAAPARNLPRTGASEALAGLAVVLLGAAFVLRRRTLEAPLD